MEFLNSRERVKRAINHQPVDRYPIDIGGHFSSGISIFAYQDLREYLGLPTKDTHVVDTVQLLARVDDDVSERFHLDCKILRPRFKETISWNPRGKYKFVIPRKMAPYLDDEGNWLVTEDGSTMRMPPGGYFFDSAWLQITESETFEELIDDCAIEAESIYKESDYYTFFMGFSGYFGDIESACDMHTDPDKIIERNERLLESNLKYVKRVIDKMGNYIGAVDATDDLGTQQSPYISPQMYCDFVLPYLKKYCDFVHQNSDLKIFMHSCGSIEPLLPHIIEAGVDIINPVQISAHNMDPTVLKKKYGDKICFWGGGCDTQNILSTATPDEVAANVKFLTDIFKPDSGFIFNQVHNIMGNVPPRNIIAMMDAAYNNSFM